MDIADIARLLGEHGARLDHLESGHEEHAETLDEHEEATEAVQASAESAQRTAEHAIDTAYSEGEHAAERAVEAAVVVATEVAAEVAEEVAEETVEEENLSGEESDVTEIVEGEKEPPTEKAPTEEKATPVTHVRKRPFGKR